MDYDEAISYIERASARGIMPGLSRIEYLLDILGNPERECNVIHVAGTNGKGSVCTYIASILETAGYRVGRYVSPTLYDYRERIQINGRWISKDETAMWMTVIRAANEEMYDREKESASAFELETAVAFLYFREQRCDFVVLETGMGGRLDATNVVPSPLVSVITSIGMDHMRFLGDSIEAIAAEKGGIIKKGRPVVIGANDQRAVEVLKKISCEREASCHLVRHDAIYIRSFSLTEGQRFDYDDFKDLQTGLLGSCQPENAAIAIETIGVLAGLPDEDYKMPLCSASVRESLNLSVIREGIASAKWPGRFEVIGQEPTVVVDGAHNPDGAMSLADSVRRYFPDQRIVLVMGVFADKDYEKMLDCLLGISDTLITFTPENGRGLDAKQLAAAAKSRFMRAEAADSQEQAIQRAYELCGKDDVMIIFGSLSTAAKTSEIIKRYAHTGNIHLIINHPLFTQSMTEIQKRERDRSFCRHDIEHSLDVARVAYILALERKLRISREMIYAAALLHDIGRWRQYTEGVPHEKASEELADQILKYTAFDERERTCILRAVKSHCHRQTNAKGIVEEKEISDENSLSELLYEADKKSRSCWLCEVRDRCFWREEKKNRSIFR